MHFVGSLFIILAHFIILSHSQSIIHSLPGYDGDLPFKLETGYVGVGENEELQLFYYFVESERNPENDPVILYIPGGPGASALISISYGRAGPLSFNDDNGLENLTITLNPYSWTKTASIIFVDIPAGTGFSYARTKEAWVSSDSIMASQATDFIKKFLIDHPKFLKNPLYVAGISYMGIVIPVVTLQLYEGNERGDQPSINIQGYIIFSPLTDKFMDFNSRLEYAHRMALISDDIYKLAIENCQGDYVNTNTTNSLCAYSLQRYEQCTRQLNLENILEPPCSDVHPASNCASYFERVLQFWANREVVQQAINVRQGTFGTWVLINNSLHYGQGKKDNPCYSYDQCCKCRPWRPINRRLGGWRRSTANDIHESVKFDGLSQNRSKSVLGGQNQSLAVKIWSKSVLFFYVSGDSKIRSPVKIRSTVGLEDKREEREREKRGDKEAERSTHSYLNRSRSHDFRLSSLSSPIMFVDWNL